MFIGGIMSLVGTFFQRFGGRSALLFVLLLALGADSVAQVYKATLQQRRRGDQLEVEVWIKSLSASAPKLGESSLVLQYNSLQLMPSATQAPATTDTVAFDVDVANPIQTITSPYDGNNGYQSLATQSYGVGYFSLEVRKVFGSISGLVPDSNGRGTFIGKLRFDILASGLTDTSLSQIAWSSSTGLGTVVMFDFSDNNIKNNVTFSNPGNFTIVGITVLNPNGPSEVVDRDKTYLSVPTGYPIYFERSGLVAAGGYGSNSVAYAFDYSLNGGGSFAEFGRAAEDSVTYLNEIDTLAVTNTTGGLAATNGREIVRTIWTRNLTFAGRSEAARVRITQLATTGAIAVRTRTTRLDVSDTDFVLGRLFFAQLNGSSQYFRTAGSFSNSTQLTVAAWVNLNEYKATGSEVGIVCTSGGPVATDEGAWMLYLKDGRYPAFRAREILGRGINGYIANIVSPEPIPSIGDAAPLTTAHGDNWMHVAATVANNRVRLYVNGEMVEEVTNDSATNIRMQTTNLPLWIGVNPNGTIDSSRYLHAGIKGVQVWRTELTQTQIRNRVAGIVTPDSVGSVPSDATFLNRGLELYCTMEGVRGDLADDASYQAGNQSLQYYLNGVVNNPLVRFRPDRGHIRLTAPTGCDGVSNLSAKNYTVRWVGYGLGDITASGADLDIEFSIDGGTSWTYARTSGGITGAYDLGPGASGAVDIEAGQATWTPYNNEGTVTNGGAAQNLRDVSGSYAKSCVLRLKGHSVSENEITFSSNSFQVAPAFAMEKSAGTKIMIPRGTAMNMVGQISMIEAWIRPYRFPTATEVSFPIVSKFDTASRKPHYALSLLPTGQLELRVTDTHGVTRRAVSDAAGSSVVERPVSVALDSTWTHVAAWINLGNGVGASEVRFYVDGNAQRVDSIATQLGDSISVNTLNTYPTFIGYEPTNGDSNARSFVGEIRDLRFWNGAPATATTSGSEPTGLTSQIQGALCARGSSLTGTSALNLQTAFDFNGGAINASGFQNSIISEVGSVHAIILGTPLCYQAATPFMKLVEPTFNQRIRNSTTDVHVRWVGFDFNGSATGFTGGVNGGASPSVEYSIRGGGGIVVQPYQYVGSLFWNAGQTNSLTLPGTLNFTGSSAGNVRYGCQLDMTLLDPDLNNDGVYTDQGTISATLTNARLRVWNTYTINGSSSTINAEGPLFTITPPSNLTLRVLLEGLHEGLDGTGAAWHNIGTSYAGGGLRIKLYADNSGSPGALVNTAESEFQYDANAFTASAITNIGTNTGDGPKFATVPFVFTDLPDGNYWVVVEQVNHLPIMSKTPITFQYSGDDVNTTTIESGWDFSTWNGTDDDVSYSAYGSAKSTTTSQLYSSTGLVYNEGRDGITGVGANYLASMVAGDCERDGQINAADRVRVRVDAGTALIRSDVTGDQIVSAIDRDIVDRNFGKISSIAGVSFPGITSGNGGGAQMVVPQTQDPFTVVSAIDPAMSESFNLAARDTRLHHSALPVKHLNSVQGSKYTYVVNASPTRNQNFIDVPVTIQNTGAAFNLGNATFAFQFNPKKLKFIGLLGTDKVPYTNNTTKGYNVMYSAPRDNADQALPDVRTIEVDYDAYARKGGLPVPNTAQAVGTLRFELLAPSSSVGFSWYKGTSVLGAQSEGLTQYGTFNTIKALIMYTASISAPTVSSKLATGRKTTVKWTTNGDADVYLEYSTDNGVSWTRSNTTAVNVKTLAYSFVTPNQAAADCYVRLVDAETNTELTRSQKFSLVYINTSISRPAPSDPIYTGGTSDVIRWQSVGLNNVHFEFSPNGNDSWSTVTTSRNATDGSTSWKIPMVNTKSAVVRLIDDESGEEMDRTEAFKVLSGSLTLLNPNTGDVFKGNDQLSLRWRTVNDVKSFDLQISTDGGSTWMANASSLSSAKNMMTWTVPALNSTNAVVRAIYPGEDQLEYSRSGIFSIQTLADVQDQPQGTQWSVGEVSPNPTNQMAELSVFTPSDSRLSVRIHNAIGELVSTVCENTLLRSGQNVIHCPCDALAPGTYFVQITNGSTTMNRKLVIIR